MKKIRMLLLATLMAAAFAMPLQAQNDGDREAVNHLLRQFEQAFNKEDTAALQGLFSDNAVLALYKHQSTVLNARRRFERKVVGSRWQIGEIELQGLCTLVDVRAPS
jgi:hypothetical protein